MRGARVTLNSLVLARFGDVGWGVITERGMCMLKVNYSRGGNDI